jgi:hypothetical protein
MSLFKSTAEVKVHAPQFAKNMSFDTLKPIIEGAEINYIIPFIGIEFFEELDTAYNSVNPLSPANAAIIKALQRALANYTAYEAARTTNLMITDSGAMEQQPENSAPARQWNHKMQLDTSIAAADRFLDYALEFLETHEDDYPTWKGSPQYLVSKALFINKTSEFNGLVDIGNSRRTFLLIRPFLKLVEDKFFVPAMGKTFFSHLKDALLQDTLSADEETLINDYLVRPLAHLAFVEASPRLKLVITGAGIKTVSSSDGITQSQDAAEMVKELIRSNQDNGTTFLASMKKYLEDNADLFPTYKNSTYYQNQQPNTDLHDNFGKNSFMV